MMRADRTPVFYIRRLGRNVFWNFGGQGWALALAFLVTPYMISRLGAEAYGVLMIGNVLTNYFVFSGFGLGQAALKYLAEHAARKEWRESSRIFWTSLAAYVGLGGLTAAAIWGVAEVAVQRWFQVGAELQEASIAVIRLSGVGMMLAMVSGAPSAVIQAQQRFDVVNVLNGVAATVQAVGTLLLLHNGCSVVGIALWNVAIGAGSVLLNVVGAWRLLPELGPPEVHAATLRKLLRFGTFQTITDVTLPFLMSFEKLVLASYVSVGAVAHYGVAYNLAAVLGRGAAGVSTALYPAFSALHGIGARSFGGRLNLTASRLLVLITILPAGLLLVFGEEILTWWVGRNFAEQGTVALRLLTVAMLVTVASWNSFTLLRALGRPDLVAALYVAEVCVHVPTTIALVSWWGIAGAGLAWITRVTLEALIVLPMASKLSGHGWGEAIKSLPNRGLGVMVAMVALIWFLKTQLREDTVFVEVLLGAMFCLLAIVVGWKWGIDGSERTFLRKLLTTHVTES